MPNRKNDELPLDIYIPFVQTLFRDSVTLAIGIAAQSLLAALVFAKTGELIYLAITVGFIVIGGARLVRMDECRRAAPPITRDEARRLENVYIFWGTLHASMLGVFCFVGIYWAQDQFAEIAAVCVTLASATSIAGRNYGSPRLVMCQIVAATWPISLGFLLRGDIYHVVLGLLSVPFFYAIRKFAEIVREVLFTALWAE